MTDHRNWVQTEKSATMENDIGKLRMCA